jgi:hypothetical protein
VLDVRESLVKLILAERETVSYVDLRTDKVLGVSLGELLDK